MPAYGKLHAPASCLCLLLCGALATVRAETGLTAFPGAEGFGRFATGGRNGSVVHVTNLNDSGPGSFREAVTRPDRTVVFDVGGVINISSRLAVSPRITIAGQTAPGGGIAVCGNGISFSGANNSITRYLRFRMGIRGDSGRDAVSIANGHDMIFDHVSVSWGRDETFSVSGLVTNITIQDCIVAQGLQPHSAGGLIQTPGGVSILRTLYIDNHTRNPKVKGANQFVNNVIYNWGGGGAYILGDSESHSYANVINNYFINGPSTSVAAFSRGNLNFHIFAAGNFQDADKNGVLDGKEVPRAGYGTVDWQEKMYDYPAIAVVPAPDAWKIIVSRAGASRWRDAVDTQLITELKSAGTLGETIRSETTAPMNGAGTIAGGAPDADTDQDGMPDFWERSAGLDPKNPDDRNRPAASGYTQLEEYLNWAAAPRAGAGVTVDLAQFTSGFTRNPVYSVVEPVNGKVKLVNGHSALFEPSENFSGSGSFRYSVTDADGSRFTGSVSIGGAHF